MRPLAKIDAAIELCGKVRELEMQRSGLRSCREEGKQNLDPGFPSEHNARSMIIPGAERLLSIDIQEAPLRYAWQKLKRNFTTEPYRNIFSTFLNLSGKNQRARFVSFLVKGISWHHSILFASIKNPKAPI